MNCLNRQTINEPIWGEAIRSLDQRLVRQRINPLSINSRITNGTIGDQQMAMALDSFARTWPKEFHPS